MADKKFGVSIVITAVDEVSKRFKEINKKIANSPIVKLNNSIRRLGSEIGLNQVIKSFGAVGSAARGVFDEVTALGSKLGLIAGLGGAGLFGLGLSFARFGDSVKDSALKLGISTKNYQLLSNAANLAGVEQEAFNTIMGRFSRNIGEAAAGTAAARVGFDALGLSVRDKVTGRVRSLDALLPEVFDKLSKIRNASVRNAVGFELFGKQFGEIVPLLADYNKFAAKAASLGVFSDDDLNAGDAFKEQFDELALVFKKVSLAAGQALLPSLSKALTSLQELLVKNKAGIVQFFERVGAALPGIIEAVGDLAKRFTEFFTMLDPKTGKFILDMGNVKLVMLAVAGVALGPLLASVVSLGASFVSLGLSVGGAVAKLVLWAATSQTGMGAILSLALRFPTLFNLISVSASAMWGVITGPIGIAVAGFAALVGVGVLLYKNWEPFRNLIDGIVAKLIAAKDAISGFLFGPGASPAASSIAPAGAALGASPVLQSVNETRTTKQEASVKVSFDNLPRGTRVETQNDGVPLDLSRGYGMLTQ